jgi:hypothetical protein
MAPVYSGRGDVGMPTRDYGGDASEAGRGAQPAKAPAVKLRAPAYGESDSLTQDFINSLPDDQLQGLAVGGDMNAIHEAFGSWAASNNITVPDVTVPPEVKVIRTRGEQRRTARTGG